MSSRDSLGEYRGSGTLRIRKAFNVPGGIKSDLDAGTQPRPKLHRALSLLTMESETSVDQRRLPSGT
ncbi:MAG TPA: hypothetical protein VEI25_21460, partial [Paraburkholderia sp.]|nr:hypothetical protein [Paraburkholderia sp.]